MKSAHRIFLLVLIFLLLTLAILFLHYKVHNTQKSAPNKLSSAHFLGGFNVNTQEEVPRALKDGVRIDFHYGQPPSNEDKLGQKLQSLHMKVVDGYISSYLHYYECHRTAMLMPSLVGPGQYCRDDPYPYLANENVLLATIANHLKQVRTNQLIIGYWVLDDWVQWDAGDARQLLMKIHDLIQRYTPGRPAICGFGGSIGTHQGYEWEDWIADNFSPLGCDEVGFYIYAPSLPDTATVPSPDAYDWSMSGILPAMFTSLQRRGWDITKVPLIGIGQAFGGSIKNTNRYWVTPNAQDIEIQSRSFCEHGAIGLAFYAWDDSGFGLTTQTPMNSLEIDRGIQNGIAACKAYWGKKS